MTDHDRAKLAGCDPRLIAAIEVVLDTLAAGGFPMMVTDGFRTLAQQEALYAKGRTVAGLVVTNADGVRSVSNHQSGRAADCVFLDAQGKPSWDLRWPWAQYGACGEANGLRWGGHFTRLHDLPHLELPPDVESVPV